MLSLGTSFTVFAVEKEVRPAAIYYEEYIEERWYVGTLDAAGEVVTLPSGLYQAAFGETIYEQ